MGELGGQAAFLDFSQFTSSLVAQGISVPGCSLVEWESPSQWGPGVWQIGSQRLGIWRTEAKRVGSLADYLDFSQFSRCLIKWGVLFLFLNSSFRLS